MEKETITLLLEQKKTLQQLIQHAISNEFNPFADNGTKRLERLREEMQRLNKELGITL